MDYQRKREACWGLYMYEQRLLSGDLGLSIVLTTGKLYSLPTALQHLLVGSLVRQHAAVFYELYGPRPEVSRGALFFWRIYPSRISGWPVDDTISVWRLRGYDMIIQGRYRSKVILGLSTSCRLFGRRWLETNTQAITDHTQGRQTRPCGEEGIPGMEDHMPCHSPRYR